MMCCLDLPNAVSISEDCYKTAEYENGHVDSVDAAVRRAVMTGVIQLKHQEPSIDCLETD
ncbi:hypothetical protein [uncultured Oscillibacter sp.]|uniref:hypothetical protein n=1 Tax=uncultured Oscillibacter sp. TaxID=876091 RepID=UPI0025E31FB4|nr:hypothetical protein [uncultured Oscillibacter sp.]